MRQCGYGAEKGSKASFDVNFEAKPEYEGVELSGTGIK